LPLAFHVTYWDRLGWKDPYSLQAATDRQGPIWPPLRRWILYAGDRRGMAPTGLVGSHRHDVGSAIEKGETRESDRRVGLASPRTAGGQVFDTGRPPAAAPARSFSSALTTTIRQRSAAGEKQRVGRCKRRNIVRSIHSVGQWSGAPLQIDERFPEGPRRRPLCSKRPDGQIIGASRLSDGSDLIA